MARIFQFHRCGDAGANLGAHSIQPAADRLIPFGVGAQRGMHHIAIGHQLGNARFQFGNGIGFIELEDFLGHGRTEPETVPDFTFQILVAAEQDVARLLAQGDGNHGFGLAEAGQIIKVAVPAVVVVRIGVARALMRSRHQQQSFFQDFCQSRTTLGVRLDIWDNNRDRQEFAFHVQPFRQAMRVPVRLHLSGNNSLKIGQALILRLSASICCGVPMFSHKPA